MNRGDLIQQFEHAQNNFAAVHHAMQLYYGDRCTLEDALMVAVVELTRINGDLVKQAQLGPGPFIIIKPPLRPT